MLDGILVDLVPFGDRHYERLAEWENGPASFWASAGEVPIISRATTERWHQEWREKLDQEHTPGFGIQTKDGTPIGSIGMNWLSAHHRSAELGASLGDPAYWGGGYGTDALLLVVEYCFDWLDLRKIIIGTMGLNARVQRQMDKVGFTLEACRRDLWYVAGEWSDDLEYAMMREDWPGRTAMVERLGLKARAPEGV